jgi:FkbM family methyltransferase
MMIDGGANIGLGTLYFKKRYPSAKIVAIEADPNIAAMLRENLETFGFSDVEVINAALAERPGTATFVSDPGGTGGRIEGAGGGVQVPAIVLSSLLDRSTDLLKLDVEGVEVAICERPSNAYVSSTICLLSITRRLAGTRS